ncbi:MAG: hypothetical protein LBG92_03365 [Prevotellaceae bacterium]|jgi:hypothetical protein|nr:hypothetical protein [Prevotellaceae bacterium]
MKSNGYILLLLFVFLFVMFLFACNRQKGYLEQALIFAGDNRLELEKVLERYSAKPEDSLKYKAAVFLIENMPGHFSYQNQAVMEAYYDAMDSVNMYSDCNVTEISSRYKAVFDRYTGAQPAVSDLKIISADYLTDNIDRAFDLWQNGNWATHLCFEEFCEYLLPCKVAELQSLDNWREYLSDTIYGDLRYMPFSAHSSHSAYWACHAVHQKLMEKYSPSKHVEMPVPHPVRRMRSLLRQTLKRDCDDNTVATVSVLRAKGIPAMIDFTPQWPNRKSGHSWYVIFDNTGKTEHFHGFNVFEDNHIDMPTGKVFRRCYAINEELLELNLSGETIPPLFRNIHIKDVTGEYQRTDNVSVKIDKPAGKHAWLSVFDNTDWRPVQWGKVSGDMATFMNMGRDVVYLPVNMTENGQTAAAPPFILTLRGEIKPVVADASQTQTLKLTRKYPAFRFSSWFAPEVIGAEIQAANRADFSDAVTLHTITLYGTLPGDVDIPQDTAQPQYRYWRYCSPSGSSCNLSELYFFQDGKDITAQGTVIGTVEKSEETVKSVNNFGKRHVFDRNPLTFFESPEATGVWVGMDFGKPEHIDRIIYMPRSDGNYITFGDEYELKYWNRGQWRSLGRKTADGVYLTFYGCPAGALFLLHDCTCGVEDRIFTYENGTQVWW